MIIVDIDGTLTNTEHRTHYLTQPKKDWDAFFEACHLDPPITPICNLVRTLAKAEHHIVYCTGRRESTRRKTLNWLQQNCLPEPFQLYMRKDGDKRHDIHVKPEMISHIPSDFIRFILEDRNSMVQKWRELGYTCLQVADGNF